MDETFRSFLILGVTPSASPEEIRRAYRRLARESHPDRIASDERGRRAAEERLRETNRAYEVLKSRHAVAPAGSHARGGARPANPAYDMFGWRESVAEQGRTEEWEEDDRTYYERALRLHFEGMEHFQAGRLREAISSLSQTVYLVQDNPHAYLTLGRAYRRLGQTAKSEAAYREAIRIHPESADARYELGVVYVQLGDRRSAEKQASVLDDIDIDLAERLRESIRGE